VLGDGLLPTPFTAEEIRAGCPAGRVVELLVEEDGEAPYRRFTRYVSCDDEGATLERGGSGGGVESSRVTWAQLQAHAAFPAAATTVDEETIDLPLGVLNCHRYTVRDDEGTTVFWFARAYPGMPVRISRQENGRTVSTTTMTSSSV
jgi:hypothetical protein